jgi:integrase
MDNFHGERGGVQTLLKSFDGYLRRRGRASSTRQQYAYSLRGFADWLGTSAVGDLTPANLELFLSHWEAEFRDRHGHGPQPSTMRGTIGALRVFFSYLEQAELLIGTDGSPRRNPMRTIDAPPCPQRPNDFLRPHEDRALLNADCPHHHRIVVWLLRYTGVRVAEARALTVADLDLSPEGESLTVRGSKSPAATRTIPLLPQLFPLVHEHLKFPEAAHGRDARDPTACDGPRHAHDDELSVASGQACGVRSRSPADELHLRNDTAGSASPRMSSNKLRRESLFRQSSHAEANVRQRSHQPWAPPRGSQQAPRALQHDNHRACVRATARANHPKGVVRSVPARSVEDASGVVRSKDLRARG